MTKIKIPNIKELKDLYKKLKALTSPTQQESRQRGYDLESIIEFLLVDEEIRTSYKLTGEQIDGSFFWSGQTFLLEAKWHAKQLPPSDIYAFKGKVDGKFHTTSGVFISYSGYSDECIDALRYGKVVNIVLFDKLDLDCIIELDIPFIEVLKFKIREAGDSGLPYVPFTFTTKASKPTKGLGLTVVPSRYGAQVDVDFGDPITPVFLVVTNLNFTEKDLLDIFQSLGLYQSVSFEFKRLTATALIVASMSTLSTMLAADYTVAFMGAILFVDGKFDVYDEEYLLETLHKKAITVDISVIRVDTPIDNNQTPALSEKNIQALKKFINSLSEGQFFYNFLGARSILRRELNDAEWNYDDKEIIFTDDIHGMPFSIDSFQKLVNHLSDLATNTATEETPWEILKETDRDEDFDDLVYEVLSEYRQRLAKLGWDDEL